MSQLLKIRAHVGFAVYLANEDHVKTAEFMQKVSWEEQGSRLKRGITHCFSVTGKWEQSERGGVFVRSFPVYFFFSPL